VTSSRRRQPDPPAAAAADPDLVAIGLRPGDRVRYRRKEGGRWHEATVERRERDGSIGVRDERGAARALALERLEVRTTGPRGAPTWEPVAERARQTEQLDLL
jgi:hypothetical protein